MNTKKVIKRFWLILTLMLLSGFFKVYAQGNGYWKLISIENNEKEEIFGKLTRQLTGEAGDLLYSFINGNNNSRFLVKGSWSALPEVLNPNDEVAVSAHIKIDKFVPPTHHFSPTNSLYFTSYYSSGSFEDKKMNTGYCSSRLTVKASTSNDPDKNVPSVSESVSIKVPESPESLKGNLFIIRVKMGGTNAYREYFYVYKWQSGQAPAIDDENDQAAVWKLESIEINEREELFGEITRQLTGETGDLVYSFVNGNNNSRFIVKGSWSALPEVLNPNDEVAVSAHIKIDKFVPPTHHFSPTNSLYFTSYYSSGSFEEKKMNTGYCSSRLTVKASTSDDPDKNVPSVSESVSIKAPESPESLKGNLFIVRIKMGGTNAYREYFYVYKWQ